MTTPQKFRKKPVEIEAMRLGGEAPTDPECIDERDLCIARIMGWMGAYGDHTASVHGEHRPFGLAIETLEGTMVAQYGDWIIRGVQGEFYPCKPDIFEATYEAATNPMKETA